MKSILMISLHGYVGANAELGKPDTGGQVVYVLELAERFSRLGKRVDLVTRQFEDQPEYDVVDENYSVWRIPFGGKKFIRKEDMHDHLKKFGTNCLGAIKKENKKYDIVYTHYWDAGWAGQKIAEELVIYWILFDLWYRNTKIIRLFYKTAEKMIDGLTDRQTKGII